MLWFALHFPALSLEIFSRGAAAPESPEPLAVIETRGNRTWVIACNQAAAAGGVRAGMMAAAAQALLEGLIVRKRDPLAEHEALTGLAAWAGRFTPTVSLQPPDGLLLEISRCLSLHRGLDNLLKQVRSGLDAMGYAATLACAPTSHAAWLLARAGTAQITRAPAELERCLAALPISLLDQPQDVLDSLEMLGAHTLGECLRLPRAGLARRFGQALPDELDRVLGKLPEARTMYVPPPSFERRLELPAPVHEAEALLFAARRLLPELEGYLALRQAGVQELTLVCCHEHTTDTALKLGFVKPTRDAGRMLLLLRETLGRTRLPAPVHSILLTAPRIEVLALSNSDLFQAHNSAADGDLLLERLRIRLGKAAVYGIETTADHRPERAWRPCQDTHHAAAAANPLRPLWLLSEPVPCHDGSLLLKTGPERIESGWWDGADIRRDYYVAEDRNGARLWVYCDRASGEWFVHGLFA